MADTGHLAPLQGDSALERLWAALFRVCGRLGDDSALRYRCDARRWRKPSMTRTMGPQSKTSRRLALRLRAAKLRQEATVEDIDFPTPRGFNRSVIMNLAQAGRVTAKHNLLISGPTGAGKSFLACAFTHAAVRRGHTALYVRTPRLLTELALSRGDGRYVRRLGQLARIGLLVLDDFLLTSPSVIEAKDLLEVI